MMFVKDLLKHLKLDTKEQVAEAYSRHNRLIRQAIRNEIRMSPVTRGLEIEESETRIKIELDKVGLPKAGSRHPY